MYDHTFNLFSPLQANLAKQEGRLKIANAEKDKAQAELDEKQAELDKVQAKFDAAMKEKMVSKSILVLSKMLVQYCNVITICCKNTFTCYLE